MRKPAKSACESRELRDRGVVGAASTSVRRRWCGRPLIPVMGVAASDSTLLEPGRGLGANARDVLVERHQRALHEAVRRTLEPCRREPTTWRQRASPHRLLPPARRPGQRRAVASVARRWNPWLPMKLAKHCGSAGRARSSATVALMIATLAVLAGSAHGQGIAGEVFPGCHIVGAAVIARTPSMVVVRRPSGAGVETDARSGLTAVSTTPPTRSAISPIHLQPWRLPGISSRTGRTFAMWTPAPPKYRLFGHSARITPQTPAMRPSYTAHRGGLVGGVVAQADGAVAWIACQRSAEEPRGSRAGCERSGRYAEVIRVRRPHGQRELLARGTAVDPPSLQLRGSHLSCRAGRTRRSARRHAGGHSAPKPRPGPRETVSGNLAARWRERWGKRTRTIDLLCGGWESLSRPRRRPRVLTTWTTLGVD